MTVKNSAIFIGSMGHDPEGGKGGTATSRGYVLEGNTILYEPYVKTSGNARDVSNTALAENSCLFENHSRRRIPKWPGLNQIVSNGESISRQNCEIPFCALCGSRDFRFHLDPLFPITF